MSARDLTLVGGGLAGLSLGIALRRRGIEVTLHEAGSYPRHRVCGEFLRGVAPDTLRALGIAECLDGGVTHRSTSWFSASGDLLASASLPGPATGISRFLLDARLAVLFERLGGRLVRHSRKSPGPEGSDGWVWTTGRQTERRARWLGLKVHFTGLAAGNGLEMHLGRGGYVGLAGIEADRVNVCGLFRIRRGAHGRGGPLLGAYLRACGLERLATRLGEATPDAASFTGISAFRLGRQRAVDGRCLLGDAGRIIPPFTGNGMSMAFESAECALDPLTAYARGTLAWNPCRERIAKALAARFRARVGAARFLHPWLIGRALPRLTTSLMRARLVPFDLLTRVVT